MQSYYNCIFTLFKVSFVYSIRFASKEGIAKKACKFFLVIFNVYFTLLYTNFLLTSYNIEGLSFIGILSNLIMTGTMLLYRWKLCIKWDYFKSMADLLSKRKVSHVPKPRFWLNIWAITGTIWQIIFIIYSVSNTSDSFILFGITIKGISGTLIAFSLNTGSALSFTMATNTFSILYVNVCHDLSSEILTLLDAVTERVDNNYDSLMEAYSSMASMVEDIDDSLSFMAFCHVVFIATSMSYLINEARHPSSVLGSISALVFFLMKLQSFVAMAISASLVSEASQKVNKKVKSLKSPSLISAVRHLRFVSLTEGDLCLTVWKIVPMRRNLILGALGAIFTYILLIDSFKI